MEWTVVTVIIGLVGLFLTVGKPILDMCTRMEKMNTELKHEQIDMSETKTQLKDLTEIVASHDLRIHVLEMQKVDKN